VTLVDAALCVGPLPAQGRNIRMPVRASFPEHYHRVVKKPLPKHINRENVITALKSKELAVEAIRYHPFQNYLPYVIPTLMRDDENDSVREILSPTSKLVSFKKDTDSAMSVDTFRETCMILYQTIDSNMAIKFDKDAAVAFYKFIFKANVAAISNGARVGRDRQAYIDILNYAARFLILQGDCEDLVVELINHKDVYSNLNLAEVLKDATTQYQPSIIRRIMQDFIHIKTNTYCNIIQQSFIKALRYSYNEKTAWKTMDFLDIFYHPKMSSYELYGCISKDFHLQALEILLHSGNTIHTTKAHHALLGLIKYCNPHGKEKFFFGIPPPSMMMERLLSKPDTRSKDIDVLFGIPEFKHKLYMQITAQHYNQDPPVASPKEAVIDLVKYDKLETLLNYEKEFESAKPYVDEAVSEMLLESARSGDEIGIKKWMGVVRSRKVLTRDLWERTDRELKRLDKTDLLKYIAKYRPKFLGIF
jgi:hypothetical protein